MDRDRDRDSDRDREEEEKEKKENKENEPVDYKDESEELGEEVDWSWGRKVGGDLLKVTS